MKFFLLISTVALMACKTAKPMLQVQQGLSGFVYRQSGNQMPAPNRPTRKPKGIVCKLYVYEAATTQQTEGMAPVFTKVKTRLISVVQTDSSGHYEIMLPAGRYSVFIKDGEQFFANESDGDGVLNPTEVFAGKITIKDWRLSTRSVY